MATVRSAARARNRPRASLAWLLLAILAALIALTARLAEADDTLSANDPDPDDDPAMGADATGGESALGRARLAEARLADEWLADERLADERLADEPRLRGRSRWGRIELAIAWRRVQGGPAEDLARRGQLWLLATWSR